MAYVYFSKSFACVAVLVGVGTLAACGKSAPSAEPAGGTTAASSPPSAEQQTATSTNAANVAAAAPQQAEVGKPAPDFTLRDLDGKSVSLHDYRGKTVVLEWFNPECPFVRNAHTKASLKTFPAEQISKGVVWLAINSNAPGKQGNGVPANAEGKKRYAMQYPILLDESGETGKRYGATNTPHMFVIDPQGVLAYQGAIDNSPDGEGESPTGGKLVNYVQAALGDLTAGRTVSTKNTKAYGCSVKYR
ncbi:thioredoxin family protein [Pendulispora brunnea]|uniref:Thioredoxin family protein n=1 Tax=Pendulispora brunnea TaxID=2905690 RepID=A0ABZ2K7X6_9BACT